MGRLNELRRSVARLTPRYFDRLASHELVEIRQNLDTVLETRARQAGIFAETPKLIVAGSTALVPYETGAVQPPAPEALGAVLSPTQVRTFLDCSAKWWFKYGVSIPEPKTSWLAFGLAIHSAIEMNSRYKLATGEDFERTGVVMAFREAWLEQIREVEFRADEDPQAMLRMGVRLVTRYIEEVAPPIRPAAVEVEVQGKIAGVAVSGRVDLLDTDGRLIDVKTASRRPSCVPPDYAFQLATYRQITPAASGEASLVTLVKTQVPQVVAHNYHVSEQDLRATRALFPLVQEGIRSGLYYPNRHSMLCSRRYCPYWRECEEEYGGTVRES